MYFRHTTYALFFKILRKTRIPDMNIFFSSSFHCYECGVAFTTRGALAGHSYIKHAMLSVVRAHVDGTSCLCCLMQFLSKVNIYLFRKTSNAYFVSEL